jgi:hypothetical protein
MRTATCRECDLLTSPNGLEDSDDVQAINPATPNTLYAGTAGRGVFKSTNGGASRTAINSGLTNLQVFALAINPVTPSTLYAGTNDGVFESFFANLFLP